MHVTMRSASTDTMTAGSFSKKLKKIIGEGGYSPKQVFNVDETGPSWKKMPSHTYVSKEEKVASGFKAAKDRLTLLVGDSTKGDAKLKPLLVQEDEEGSSLNVSVHLLKPHSLSISSQETHHQPVEKLCHRPIVTHETPTPSPASLPAVHETLLPTPATHETPTTPSTAVQIFQTEADTPAFLQQ